MMSFMYLICHITSKMTEAENKVNFHNKPLSHQRSKGKSDCHCLEERELVLFVQEHIQQLAKEKLVNGFNYYVMKSTELCELCV